MLKQIAPHKPIAKIFLFFIDKTSLSKNYSCPLEDSYNITKQLGYSLHGLWILDDEYLMKLLLEVRNNGYESYLLPQKHELPFGYTRDDILICAWD